MLKAYKIRIVARATTTLAEQEDKTFEEIINSNYSKLDNVDKENILKEIENL